MRYNEFLANDLVHFCGYVTDCVRIAVAKMSRPLLNRAREIIDNLMDEEDPVAIEIDFQSLRGSVLGLWETAANTSVFHQEILSILESAILSIDAPAKEQLLVFREAIADLEANPITQAHVDVIRTQFIK